ncbi:nitrate/nitrite two-component system sensor histidine kinase NarQ [Aeromonas sp. FDAARGOS 1407]|uniref:nitrate/nitrite two-component system sensor histidine kinase NarQ n=1 Tax=Aeromonas TaxID=642 RepID=UPI001C2203FA|nr:nitrate/nitrite two-component system sensor histidine kinase NarQ [Aeromonas sp. FDAARGOS 1407]QXC32293.1 nitrate/nitrite two-component system sensor histidine kinase NarQ [Aeromonas sp. FDAARGOS 1407]
MQKRFRVRSVSSAIGRSMILILFMASLIALVAMVTLFYSVPDAKAINLSGSLRMQAYRMAYEIEQGESVLGRLNQFEETLHARELQETQRWITPASLRRTYGEVVSQWQEMRQHIEDRTPRRYTDNTEKFVAAIDNFVNQMQYHVEFKVRMLALAEGLGLLSIITIAWFTVRFTRQQVVAPLNQLVYCARQIQRQEFDLILPAHRDNELGELSRAFGTMADELGKLYRELENKVEEKTAKLQQANDTLSFLYSTAQKLHTAPLSTRTLIKLLDRAAAHQHIDYIRLTRFENNVMPVYLSGRTGWPGDLDAVASFYLQMDEQEFGRLDIISQHPIDERLIKNFTMLLAQVLHKDQTLLQQQRLLLMEERAVIARELHDSLAQALSYLKIQSTLLKRSHAKGQQEKALEAMQQIDEGLSNAYTQLRELLGTFRLTIGDANLGEAIRVMLEQLQPQTTTEIRLHYGLSDTDLEAGQHIHILQLIREAVLNAIKHAHAQVIDVSCQTLADGNIEVQISDDGVGIGLASSAINHYGLSIMNERASKLHGLLTISELQPQGTRVHLTFPTSLTRDA